MNCVNSEYKFDIKFTETQKNILKTYNKSHLEKLIVYSVLNYLAGKSKNAGIEYFDLFGSNKNKLKSILNSPETLKQSVHAHITNMIISQIINKDKNTYVNQALQNVQLYTETNGILNVNSNTLADEYYTNTSGVRNVFGEVMVLTDDSSEGTTLISSNDPELFVVKVPKWEDDELQSEALVGLLALNKVREYVPNFPFCYGYGNCSPIIKGKHNITSWCESYSNFPASFVIFENVINSVSFVDFVKIRNISQSSFIKCFLQILNALNIAYFKYGYLHHDLHGKNVLVRKFDTDVSVKMYKIIENMKTKKLELKQYGIIKTRYVPYIIDYGYNTILIDGVHLRNNSLLEDDLIGGVENWAYDPMRLINYVGLYNDIPLIPEFNFIANLFYKQSDYDILKYCNFYDNDSRKQFIDLSDFVSRNSSYDAIIEQIILKYPSVVNNTIIENEIKHCDVAPKRILSPNMLIRDVYSLYSIISNITNITNNGDKEIIDVLQKVSVTNLFSTKRSEIIQRYNDLQKGPLGEDFYANGIKYLNFHSQYLYAGACNNIISEINDFNKAFEFIQNYISENEYNKIKYEEKLLVIYHMKLSKSVSDFRDKLKFYIDELNNSEYREIKVGLNGETAIIEDLLNMDASLN